MTNEIIDECRDRWHDEGGERRPDCPTCGVEDDYCFDCDSSGWLPNDDEDATEDDWPWKPCPWCNKNAAIPCPFTYVAVEPVERE